MALPQTLEVNERGTALHDGQGNFLGYEDIETVSEEQLADEAEAKEVEKIIDGLPDKLKKVFKRLQKKGSL